MSKRLQKFNLFFKKIQSIRMLGFKKNNNKDELKETAFERIMDSVSNRRQIQHLRKRLFLNLDYSPYKIKKYNLNLSIEHEYWYEISSTSTTILTLLVENNWIYKFYILNNKFEDLLLNGESNLFNYELNYEQKLRNLINDKMLKEMDKFRYYQKLYDFIISDLTYGNIYDYLHPIDSSDSDSE